KVVAIATANGKVGRGQTIQGALTGTTGGGQEATTLNSQLTFKGDGKPVTRTFSYTPLYTASKWGIGFTVSGPNAVADTLDSTSVGPGVAYVPTTAGATYTISAFDYLVPATIQYTLTLT